MVQKKRSYETVMDDEAQVLLSSFAEDEAQQDLNHSRLWMSVFSRTLKEDETQPWWEKRSRRHRVFS